MIQELKIKNVLSFKNEVTFSFVASSDQFAEDSQVVKIKLGSFRSNLTLFRQMNRPTSN